MLLKIQNAKPFKFNCNIIFSSLQCNSSVSRGLAIGSYQQIVKKPLIYESVTDVETGKALANIHSVT